MQLIHHGWLTQYFISYLISTVEKGWVMTVHAHFDVASYDTKGQIEVSIPELEVKKTAEVTLSPENNTATVTVQAQKVCKKHRVY